MGRPTNEVLGVLAFLANTRGIIPNPITATRVNEHGTVSGAAATTFYTVAAGKLLFISSAWMASREGVATASSCATIIYTNLDGVYMRLLNHYYDVAGHQVYSNQYHPAIEVPAGYYVVVESGHANIDAAAGFSGWLEDV